MPTLDPESAGLTMTGLLTVVPLFVCEPYVIYDGDTALREDHLHGDLVHAVCRGQNITSGVGYARHLEGALYRSVLAIGAVQCGQYDVDFGRHVAAEEPLANLVETVVAVYGTQIYLLARGEELIHVFVVLAVAQRLARVPMALLGDIYGRDVVLFGVDGLHGLYGRYDRDLVLDRAAAEDDADIGLSVLVHIRCVSIRLAAALFNRLYMLSCVVM